MKALIAMSGGVDSSVAAYLAKKAGLECIGCTMRLFRNEDVGISHVKTCCSLDDVEDAQSVAHKIGIPYYVFNFSDGFREKVIEKFVRSYESGATPNPCIDCNRYMKFDKLYERAKILGCEYIVTGHYARIEKQDGKYVLKKALDETKDQSYVLYSLTQEQLEHALFPLGNMSKSDARRIAEENGFINADKPDSQDICFVPNGKYAEFLEYYTGKSYSAGRFIYSDGTVLGEHKGIVRYTVGQHKGLGISSEEPLYVKAINAEDNTVTLCKERELYSKDVFVNNFNWISSEAPQSEIRCVAKIRYRQKEQWATVMPINETAVKIVFDKPQRAVTPGQAAVLYSDDTVLGGGTISKFDT
ncbi:MAG: tRNA 2-thiouridine(34) synthase MnmA [Clostridia bacterium]|nr:tRNA 2-thiouridine(34) synthase MnmA [Clostridia bacterium]